MRAKRLTSFRPRLRLPVFLLLFVAVVATEASGGAAPAGLDDRPVELEHRGPYTLRFAQAAARCVAHVGQLAGGR